ncbi:MAG: glycerol-3-phosphate ABC transporter ATP-binding protein [Deltaproteobacteria bacterium]|nr:MAG: glycerol-3-phosphate ABC transporter ATP-binding protein [Deltaproteobacteria bacterium]RLC17923.1 MAG: glycerol-3-phosphate ABC transporter ATP-binding protein [Deltaproteobacteria bacterium]HHE75164.1 sn-glycerol-3-phosphate ABC transporter ATP-binding protein UgpC [Desulfobacteraceae bacterium]
MAEVSLEKVVKAFGKTEVVHGIDLEIKDLEFAVLVGPSGCGKSTVLRMVAGLEQITSGVIHIGDRVVNDVAPKDRSVAMVFQNYALYPHMNVFNNMSFGLKLRKKPKEEIEKRVNDAASILGLQDLLLRKPFELSGGQRQRVAMGRAIVRKPSVFLFDEPLSNLDAKLRTQMRTEIKRLHKNVQSTIIYVTHDQVEAMTLADRIVVMKDGNIEQIGKPLELFENPVNTFVAGFIGSPPMNLVSAKIVSKNARLTLQFNTDFNIPIPEKSGHSLKDGMTVTMGLRTEDLTIDNDNNSFPDPWMVNGLVEVVEPLGGETIMHMDFNGVKFVAKSEGRRIVRPGEKIRIAMNLKHLHIFDVDSSLSIY